MADPTAKHTKGQARSRKTYQPPRIQLSLPLDDLTGSPLSQPQDEWNPAGPLPFLFHGNAPKEQP